MVDALNKWGSIIAFVIAVAIAYGIISFAEQAEPATTDFYKGVEPDERLLEMDRRALDEAYQGHLIKLWNVWLSDGATEAARITRGLHIARQAYKQADEQITKREKEFHR